jgi:hypothetical protein
MSRERYTGASSLRRRIETVFDARALGRAMLALVPLLLLALVSGSSEWLTAAIKTSASASRPRAGFLSPVPVLGGNPYILTLGANP